MKTELIRTEIESQIKRLTGKVEEGKTKMATDFVYWFPWIGKELWIMDFKLSVFKTIVSTVKEDFSFEMSITLQIDHLRDYTSRSYNVRENSSSALHSEVSTWKFIAMMELLNELEQIIRRSN
jgi:hypothetical protein